MKKLLLLVLSLFIISCSIDRKDEVIIGLDGKTSLVRTFQELAGSNCVNGGLKIQFGLDQNDDLILQDDEVSSTSYVCNGLDGADGSSSKIEIEVINGNENCPNGGVIATTGIDFNDNGTLEEDEITYTTFICNGENGQDGEDGYTTLTTTTRIEESEQCTLGGFLIETGLDTNRNSALDSNEIDTSNTTYICDGEDGKSLAVSVEYLTEENQYCSNGGYLLNIGIDQNGNEELEESEESVSFPICNGNDGEDGEDGLNGTNGLSLVSNTTEIEGGTLVELFIDSDNSGDYSDGDILVNSFTVLNGQDGEDGLQGPQGPVGPQGIQGEPGPAGPKGDSGEDGTDGVNAYQILSSSTTIDGVTTVTFYQDINDNGIVDQGDLIINQFVINDGEDGTDGEDGETPVVTYEVIEEGTVINNYTYEYGGVRVIITIGDTVTTFIVENGPQGPAGNNGQDGEDGEDGICEECEQECEDGTVTICHKVTHTNNTPEEWENQDYVELTLTLSEYVKHRFEHHNGNSSQQDSWGLCEGFEAVRVGVKDPQNRFGTGNGANCHWNWSTMVATSQQELDWLFNGGGTGDFAIPYPSRTFLLPDNKDADDFDCDSTPNI